MNIFQTVYDILNPAQIGLQIGRNVAQDLIPEPQWILTPYAESRLKEINPGEYITIVEAYNKAKQASADTVAALNPFSAVVDFVKQPATIAGIVIIAIIIIAIIARKK